MPDNPGAWLVTTARHRAIDRLRRDRVLAAKLHLLAPEPAMPEPTMGEESMTDPPIPDERLELVFMCCHPALARPFSRVSGLFGVFGFFGPASL